MLTEDKALLLHVSGPEISERLLNDATAAGVRGLVADGPLSTPVPLNGLPVFEISEGEGENKARWIKVARASDVDRAVAASTSRLAFVVVECANWKIIPLENLIAEFRRRGRKLYAYADSKEQIETAFAVLERGVDGVVIPPSSVAEARGVSGRRAKLALEPAEVTRIVDAGVGDRACVDTTSQLEVGEGMLVGSRGGFFFLVHGETIPSEYIATRPFRVNAGAVHSYTLTSDGKTRYLSELEPPDRVTIVSSGGASREASVGRVKIERRPLVLVDAKSGTGSGAVILQKAETIRLVRPSGDAVSVTELKAGDVVLVHTEAARARHFGVEVDEHIDEK
ncbi:MAG: 3-dehydroquinate synthase [Nitrososphaerota archaeon]|nr:3-dehydroquinate synthase [Nitrososphaerota archaeon]